MADQRVTVNNFSWQELFPVALIFRALPASLSMTVLVLALFGVALTPIGWLVMEKLFVSQELMAEPEFAEVAELYRSPYKAVYPQWQSGDSMLTVLGHQMRGVELVFKAMLNSVAGVFSTQPGIGRFLYFFGGALWTLLVWSFFGCAITRTALMSYTRDEPIGIDDGFDFAFDKFLACFTGVAIPLLAVFGMTLPLVFMGLIMKTGIGTAIGGLLWFVVLAISLLIAVILIGLAFAWPLIISAISCEGQDSFDGMSRAFGYLFQRPMHFFAYLIVAVIFSGICWLVASQIIEVAVHTSYWATSWGTNMTPGQLLANESEFMEDVIRDERSPGGATRAFGRMMIKFWTAFARTVGAAFLYGLFWCVAAAVYLLLRKDLDETEMDEIYLVDQRRTYELPPLNEVDGVPQVDEEAVLPAQIDPPTPEDQAIDSADDS